MARPGVRWAACGTSAICHEGTCSRVEVTASSDLGPGCEVGSACLASASRSASRSIVFSRRSRLRLSLRPRILERWIERACRPTISAHLGGRAVVGGTDCVSACGDITRWKRWTPRVGGGDGVRWSACGESLGEAFGPFECLRCAQGLVLAMVPACLPCLPAQQVEWSGGKRKYGGATQANGIEYSLARFSMRSRQPTPQLLLHTALVPTSASLLSSLAGKRRY